MATIPGGSFTLALALSILSFSTSVISAQGGRSGTKDLRSAGTVGLGYVVSAPREMVGFSALAITPGLFGGAGVYADVKFTHGGSPESDPYFFSDITPEQVEATHDDHSFEGKSVWFSANLALVYAVSPELGVYLGGGYSKEQHYREYFDITLTRGFHGFYWVRDENTSGNRINTLGGLFMRAAPHLLIQIGGETAPLGGTVGLTLTLPF